MNGSLRTGEPGAYIYVNVSRAHDIMCGDEDELKSDPYCEVSLHTQDASGSRERFSSKKQTATVEDSLSPVWNSSFAFSRPDDLPADTRLLLHFVIYDEDFYGMCSKYLGEFFHDVTDVTYKGDLYADADAVNGLKLVATKEIRGIVIKDAFPEDEFIGTLDISVATGNHSKAPSDLGENTRPEAKAAKLSKRGVKGFGGDLLSVAGKIKIGRTLGSSDKTKHYHYLYITVLAGRSLVTPDLTGDIDPLCEVIVSGPDNKKPQRTALLERTANPEWDERDILVFRADQTTSHIRIKVYDSNRMRSTPTGEVLLRAPKVVDKQHPIRYDPIDKWYNIVPGLLSSMRAKRYKTDPNNPEVAQLGQLKVRVDWGYDPTPALTLGQRPRWRHNIGYLSVKIDDCENLADVDNSFMSGTTDPFIVVECEGREETTPTFFNNADPKFNWECTFEVTEINTFLRLNFWDFDGGKLNGEDSQFGLVVIPINHLLQGVNKPHKLRLEILPPEESGFHRTHSRKKGPKHLGWVNLSLTLNPTRSLTYMTAPVLNPIATGLEVDEFSLVKTFAQTSRIVDTLIAPLRGLLRTIELLQSWRVPMLNMTLGGCAVGMYSIPVWLMWNLLPLYLLLSFNLYGFLVHRARLTTPVFFDKPTRDIVAKCQATKRMAKLEVARLKREKEEAEREKQKVKTAEELEMEAMDAAEDKRKKKGFLSNVSGFVGNGLGKVVDAPGKIVGGVTSGAFIPMYDKIQGVMKTVSEVTQMLEGVANNMERFGNLLVWGDPTVTGRFVLWGILPIAVVLIIAWNTFLWLATHISINQVLLAWHLILLMPGRNTTQEIILLIDGFIHMVPQLTLTPISEVSKFCLEARAREEKVRLKLHPPSKSQLAKQAKKDALNHLATSEGIQVYAANAKKSWPVWMFHLQQRAPTNDELFSQWLFEYNLQHSAGPKRSPPATWEYGQNKYVRRATTKKLLDDINQEIIRKKNKKKKRAAVVHEEVENSQNSNDPKKEL